MEKLLDDDDEDVLRLQIKNGKIKTRPHAKLDHDSPEVQELPEEKRKQYQRVEEFEITSTTTSNRIRQGSSEMPEDFDAPPTNNLMLS